ncbi:hypothetical protein Dimus_025870 [Dionaea muscipula]
MEEPSAPTTRDGEEPSPAPQSPPPVISGPGSLVSGSDSVSPSSSLRRSLQLASNSNLVDSGAGSCGSHRKRRRIEAKREPISEEGNSDARAFDLCSVEIESGDDPVPTVMGNGVRVSDSGGRGVGVMEERVVEMTVEVKECVEEKEGKLLEGAAREMKKSGKWKSCDRLDLPSNAAQREVPSAPAVQEIEDLPGPFPAAMKIIQDREKKILDHHNKILSMNKDGVSSIKWSPRIEQAREEKIQVPSLKDLCLSVLAENADAITSLQLIPDEIRHKLSQILCCSGKMTAQFFNLLLQGSPSEIRLSDCSWMTEEQFTESFQSCDTSNLTSNAASSYAVFLISEIFKDKMLFIPAYRAAVQLKVLQLDQCGRCLSDYTLIATLAHKRLPALTAISLKGACCLSDTGLSALVSAAPALRSINLSQCSLLTVVGINSMADSLGSIMSELYLDDCQTLDVMLVLPSLKKLNHLKVLSLAGIPSVSDEFVRELVTANGHKLKELILADCGNLTDSSLKAIAQNCSVMCALDVANLYKLTDVGVEYLANGLQAIESLKFCRNKFSDKAVAALIETRWESLKELSLNNVKKVWLQTAISLAKCCRNLVSLDLSWCRSVTDGPLIVIVNRCLSLRVLKLFGCTQVTTRFLDGHSNPNVKVIGLKLTPVLEHMKKDPDAHVGPLRYSSAF